MKGNQKERIFATLQIAVFGLLSLILAVFTVLELIPAPSEGIEVSQPIAVSSSSLSPIEVEIKDYHTQVGGALFNPTGDAVAVESVEIKVSDGTHETSVTVEGFTLPARTSYELFAEFEGQIAYDRVVAVKLISGGREDVLQNQVASAFGVSGVAVFYLLLLAGTAFLTVRAAKIRYYLHQENAKQ